jgi:hypothetical protein
MNDDEILNLLEIAQAFDKRTIGEPDVVAWTDSAKRGRWTYDEAQEVIKEYYARTTAERPWIMPSHVTNMVRANRDVEAMRFRRDALPPINPRVAQAIETVAATTHIPAEPRPMRNTSLSVPCPHCKAAIGQNCTRPRLNGRPVLMQPHPSRKELALDTNKGSVAE